MKYFCALFFCMLSMPLHAQQHDAGLPRFGVAQFPVAASGDIEIKDAEMIRLLVASNLAASDQITVVPPDAVDRLLREQNIPVHEIYKPENIKKIPQTFVRYLVTGFVSVEAKGYRVSLKLLDITSEQFLLGEEELVGKNVGAIRQGVKKLSDRFLDDVYATPMLTMEGSDFYAIGDTGPAGGIIFFAKSARTDGWRYMEAAPPETEFRAPWGVLLSDGRMAPVVQGTESGVGTGVRNTQLINGRIALEKGVSGKASQLCALLNTGGYTDWYLPSKDELMLMYKNLNSLGLGDFTADTYWTSTQSSEQSAYYQSFREGKQFFNGGKLEAHSVRAARVF
jgi:hypothetical protein